MARIDPVDGLGIIPRWMHDDAYVERTSGYPSDVDEAGPTPGIAAATVGSHPRLVPRISGGQGGDLAVRVCSAGGPSDVELAYQANELSGTTWAGWSPHNLIVGWDPPLWTDTDTYDVMAGAVVPSCGVVVFVARESGGADYTQVGHWDPHPDGYESGGWTWDMMSATDLTGETAYEAMAMCALPDDRLLLVEGGHLAWISDWTATGHCPGETWEIASRDTFPGKYNAPYGWGRARMVVLGADVIYVARETSSSGDLLQFASTDLGLSFTEVEEQTGLLPADATPRGPSLVVALDRAVLGYVAASTYYPTVQIITRASSAFSDGTTVVIDEEACDEVELVADPDGLLWAYVRTDDEVDVWYSMTGGESWTQMERGLHDTGGASDYLTNFLGFSAGGYHVILSNLVANTGNEDGSVVATITGGWSTVTAAPWYTDPAVPGRQLRSRAG